jgi:UDP-N-acetylmuramoyl-tripeptide--D-alanyl-D-alanine ligase
VSGDFNMTTTEEILKKLEECDFNVSTDTRKNISGSVYFALKGDSFDGNLFAHDALQKGAVAAVTENPENLKIKNGKIFLVKNVLKTLQDTAKIYRQSFNIPILAIGGSNGKTTSKGLLCDVLKTKYKTHSTVESFNNHFGVPLSILSMNKKTEIAVFEIGANHRGEHTELLDILQPTHVVVTNNGLDHLEGFGSPEGSRLANKEIYDWALQNGAKVFAHKKHPDLAEDSKNNERIFYPAEILESDNATPLGIIWNGKKYQTKLFGNYNLENIELAISIGQYFDVTPDVALAAVCRYEPTGKRSEFRTKNKINFIVDCYNANPTSMLLSLESFLKSGKKSAGVILGDMLELGKYSETEHKKIVDFVFRQKFDCIVFVGEKFKKALMSETKKYLWFPNSEEASVWFAEQKFAGFTFLLKGSRGMKIEKVLEVLQ